MFTLFVVLYVCLIPCLVPTASYPANFHKYAKLISLLLLIWTFINLSNLVYIV